MSFAATTALAFACLVGSLFLKNIKQIAIVAVSVLGLAAIVKAFASDLDILRFMRSTGFRLDGLLTTIQVLVLWFAVARTVGLRLNRNRGKYNPIVEFIALVLAILLLDHVLRLIGGRVIIIPSSLLP